MLRTYLFIIICILFTSACLLFFFVNKKDKKIRCSGPLDITKAVIHHTSGSKDRNLTVADIDKMHKENGWDGIGYHWVIYKDGSVHSGRSMYTVGAHAKTCGPNRNHWVGIAVVGFDKFNYHQLHSLDHLLIKLGTKTVQRHHEECPGPGIKVELIQSWLNKLTPKYRTESCKYDTKF